MNPADFSVCSDFNADFAAASSADSVPSTDVGTICAALMAGGAGTRLWPESRKNRPKPFLPLLPDGRSTLAATFDRLDGLVPTANRWVVAGRAFETLVRETLPTLAPNRSLLEPCGRDTAPCIAWAALEAVAVDPNATLIVLPSDHVVSPDSAFRAALTAAVRLVADDPTRLATLGIVPTEPSSAYGYIEIGAPLESASEPAAFSVAAFREKPDSETARRFLASGRHFWNAGIFVWKARRILDAIREFEPSLAATLDRLESLVSEAAARGIPTTEAFPDEFERVFSTATRISIDYAVLERAPNVVVLKAPFAWDDLGSFSALERLTTAAKPTQNRLVDGENSGVGADVIAENARGNYVRVLADVDSNGAPLPLATASAPRRKLVALVGVDDLLVVETSDALLVARKGDDAALKRLVERLKSTGFDAYL